jgi:DNA repair exonuclease SbcCD ATPase subunit
MVPEKTPPMSTKRGKLTAGKARERVASLEESIAARQHRLDQLEARLERSESPDERLLTAKTRLERRLALERGQLEKLQKLLSRDTSQPEESGEFFASEEIDDLHRSFEEVRQNLVQMQARIDSSELPRDLSARLTSFEERVSRREEVDSELFGQVLALQNGLDQERQTVRRLSRRTREQDQSLDALREAVEDSVVATVDLAQRLEELEEALSENAEARPGSRLEAGSPGGWQGPLETLRELVEDTRQGLVGLQREVVASLEQAEQEREELRAAQAALAQKQAEVAAQAQADAEQLIQARRALSEAHSALAARMEALQLQAEQALARPALSEEALAPLLARLEGLEKACSQEISTEPRSAQPAPAERAASPAETPPPRPAVFASNGASKKRVAQFGAQPAVVHPSAGGTPFSPAGGKLSLPRDK